MPIIDKITIAKGKYGDSLKKLQAFASENTEDADFEKKMVGMLMDMIEIKTEIDILEKVNNHRSGQQ